MQVWSAFLANNMELETGSSFTCLPSGPNDKASLLWMVSIKLGAVGHIDFAILHCCTAPCLRVGLKACFSPMTWNFRLVPALQVFLEVHITWLTCSEWDLSSCCNQSHGSAMVRGCSVSLRVGLWGISHQIHGITGWFQFHKSSVLSLVQGWCAVEWTQSSWCCQRHGVSLVHCVSALNSYWPIRHFSPTIRSIYRLAFAREPSFWCILQCIYEVEWTQSNLCCLYIEFIMFDARIYQLLHCFVQRATHGKHFAWTMRVMSTLPTCGIIQL